MTLKLSFKKIDKVKFTDYTDFSDDSKHLMHN